MRGNISKRGKKSWQLKFDVAKLNDKRQTRYATVRGTYKDAQRELTRLLGAADDGILPDPTSATVAEYLRSWLNGPLGLSPKTLERYRELSDRQIIPHLGAEKLQKLKPEMIRHWHAALIERLAPRTVHHAHRLLRQVLACAVKDGKLARNVADIHAPPKVNRSEVEILPFERIEDVLRELLRVTRFILSSP